MKKSFGVLSLIAILMVAFTSQASANDTVDCKVEFAVTHSSSFAVDTVAFEVPEVFGLLNFSVDELTASKEGASNANIVSSNSIISSKFGNSFAEVFLPNEVGLSEKTFNYNLNENTSQAGTINYSVESRYSDAPKPIGWNC
jgi:hypothetical protein